MNHVRAALTIVYLSVATLVGLNLIGPAAIAQSTATPNSDSAAQQPGQPSGEQNSASEQKTFMGKILKTGDKLVLSDSENKTTYQLDDQQKAEEYINKNVKVTGVLDAATGTIRVSAIEPA